MTFETLVLWKVLFPAFVFLLRTMATETDQDLIDSSMKNGIGDTRLLLAGNRVEKGQYDQDENYITERTFHKGDCIIIDG